MANVGVENYGGPNGVRIQVGSLSIWFSYSTPVAFASNGRRMVRKNEWSTTTGKHLNAIDGGGAAQKDRVDSQTFEAALNAEIARREGQA